MSVFQDVLSMTILAGFGVLIYMKNTDKSFKQVWSELKSVFEGDESE